MLAQGLQGFAAGVDGDRLLDQIEQVVGDEGEAADVIEVAVRQEDVADALLLRQREIADAGPGVDQDFLVEQQTGRPQTRADAAAAAENLDAHSQPAVMTGRC